MKARCSWDAYAVFFQRELWLVGLNISYSHSGTALPAMATPEAARPRHQLQHWSSRVDREGLASFRLPSTSRTDEPDLDGLAGQATIAARTSQRRRPRRPKGDVSRQPRRPPRQVQLAAITAPLGGRRGEFDSALGAGGELEDATAAAT